MTDKTSSPRTRALPDHPAVFRFLSGHSHAGGPPQRDTPPIVFLHIPKTAGSYLIDLIVHNLQIADRPDLFYAPHWMSAARTAELFGPDRRLALILRDPVDRFVSAFQSRHRQGAPAYDTPWTDHEARVFRDYPDLDALIDALGSLWPKRRRAAVAAVAGMTLVPRDYTHAFGSLTGAQTSLEALSLCLPMARLDRDLGLAMTALGFERFEMAERPLRNMAPTRPTLSPRRRSILERHLAEDIAIHDVLHQHATRLHPE
ncbi:MAG: hypothetical protein AAGE76_06475 [Pseudomonadota bacterium]